ncbi:hypothetical protein CCHR01_12664 [Colletotrichum chrysophilum]|uniref:Uncharacterized protein n=1 Tax=Colletotrichum chrysophilum TaxID=1836956 RepID=A0AAD9EB59_9PEZI|nr:hypothetical protein CCHR01_12664 [Colletotrichum chrysophilum]
MLSEGSVEEWATAVFLAWFYSQIAAAGLFGLRVNCRKEVELVGRWDMRLSLTSGAGRVPRLCRIGLDEILVLSPCSWCSIFHLSWSLW